MQTTTRLAGGTFLVTPTEHLQPGELVAVQTGVSVDVAAVVAVAGQTLARKGWGLLVDGAPHVAIPLNPAGQRPRLREALTVPAGHIVVYADPLRPVALSAVLGRITYRWTPIPARGPVTWPPP